jgi:hypothetical protein
MSQAIRASRQGQIWWQTTNLGQAASEPTNLSIIKVDKYLQLLLSFSCAFCLVCENLSQFHSSALFCLCIWVKGFIVQWLVREVLF